MRIVRQPNHIRVQQTRLRQQLPRIRSTPGPPSFWASPRWHTLRRKRFFAIQKNLVALHLDIAEPDAVAQLFSCTLTLPC